MCAIYIAGGLTSLIMIIVVAQFNKSTVLASNMASVYQISACPTNDANRLFRVTY